MMDISELDFDLSESNIDDLSGAEECVVIARVLGRLPYPTRLAILHALIVQEHLPTCRAEDDAAERLRRALKLANVEGA